MSRTSFCTNFSAAGHRSIVFACKRFVLWQSNFLPGESYWRRLLPKYLSLLLQQRDGGPLAQTTQWKWAFFNDSDCFESQIRRAVRILQERLLKNILASSPLFGLLSNDQAHTKTLVRVQKFFPQDFNWDNAATYCRPSKSYTITSGSKHFQTPLLTKIVSIDLSLPYRMKPNVTVRISLM